MAAQLSLLSDAECLKQRARAYDTEADRIDAASEQDGSPSRKPESKT